jgi:SPOR domain
MMKRINFFAPFLIFLSLVVLFTGCAGIRPAIQPVVVEQPPLEEAETVSDTLNVETEVETPIITPEDPILAEVGETLIETNDELELPEEALPGNLTPMTKVEFLPNDGPQDPGEEPATIIQGWKVQLSSVTDQNLAEEMKAEAQGKSDIDVSIKWFDNSYKILIGNFTVLEEAEALRDEMRNKGYEGAFVIGTNVKQESSGKENVATSAIKTEVVEGWRIQVMSLSTRTYAEQAARRISAKTSYEAYIDEENGLFKIRVGNFRSRDEAAIARSNVVANGYDGAFPVKTMIIVEATD